LADVLRVTDARLGVCGGEEDEGPVGVYGDVGTAGKDVNIGVGSVASEKYEPAEAGVCGCGGGGWECIWLDDVCCDDGRFELLPGLFKSRSDTTLGGPFLLDNRRGMGSGGEACP